MSPRTLPERGRVRPVHSVRSPRASCQPRARPLGRVAGSEASPVRARPALRRRAACAASRLHACAPARCDLLSVRRGPRRRAGRSVHDSVHARGSSGRRAPEALLQQQRRFRVAALVCQAARTQCSAECRVRRGVRGCEPQTAFSTRDGLRQHAKRCSGSAPRLLRCEDAGARLETSRLARAFRRGRRCRVRHRERARKTSRAVRRWSRARARPRISTAVHFLLRDGVS